MLSFLWRLNENFGLGYQTGYIFGCQGQCFRLHLRISLLSLSFPGARRRLGCEFSGDQVRQDQVRSGQIRSDQVRSDQVRSGQIRSGQIRSDHISNNNNNNSNNDEDNNTNDICKLVFVLAHPSSSPALGYPILEFPRFQFNPC